MLDQGKRKIKNGKNWGPWVVKFLCKNSAAWGELTIDSISKEKQDRATMSLCEGGLDSCIVCHKDRKWRDCLLDFWLIKLVANVGLDNDVVSATAPHCFYQLGGHMVTWSWLMVLWCNGV